MGAVSWEFCKDYTHHGLGKDAAYLSGHGDILPVLRYNVHDLQPLIWLMKVLFSIDIVEQNDAVIESSQDEPLLNEE